MKRIITFFIVLSLLLASFSSCAQKSSDEIATDAEDTTEEIEYNIPDGLDKELYMEAQKALIQLDDKTKEEIGKKLNKISWGHIDESTAEIKGGLHCYGKFENCIVIFFEYGIATIVGKQVVYGYEFTAPSTFALLAYCDGLLHSIPDAYELGYISKEEIGIVYKNYKTINKYEMALRVFERYNEAKAVLVELDESKKKEIETALGQELEWLKPENTKEAWNNKLFCYGKFEKCTVLFLPNLNNAQGKSINIRNITIYSPFDFCLYVYCDGVVYTLNEAYEAGYISDTEIEVVKKSNHKVSLYFEWGFIHYPENY